MHASSQAGAGMGSAAPASQTGLEVAAANARIIRREILGDITHNAAVGWMITERIRRKDLTTKHQSVRQDPVVWPDADVITYSAVHTQERTPPDPTMPRDHNVR